MVADAAAYAVLGLEPGADWAAVERAYRELIKVHHPDRSGGDAQRATEIIHAYRELKRARDANGALVFTLGPLKPPRADRPVAAAREPAADPMDSDPSAALIDAAVRDATRIFRTRDEIALASASRDCHNRLRAEPSLGQLDRCAAFDDA